MSLFTYVLHKVYKHDMDPYRETKINIFVRFMADVVYSERIRMHWELVAARHSIDNLTRHKKRMDYAFNVAIESIGRLELERDGYRPACRI